MTRFASLIVMALLVIGTMFFNSNAAAAAIIPLDDFRDLWGSPSALRGVQMAIGDNLMYDDGVVTESVGLDGSTWHMGFVDYDGGNIFIVGWAWNAQKTVAGREGRMGGEYSSDLGTYDSDGIPDDVYVVHDSANDGIGVLDTSGGGSWILGVDDTFYTRQDILFGPSQIRGDVSQLPAFEGPSTLILPQMTVSPNVVPLPSSLLLLVGMGLTALRRRRQS